MNSFQLLPGGPSSAKKLPDIRECPVTVQEALVDFLDRLLPDMCPSLEHPDMTKKTMEEIAIDVIERKGHRYVLGILHTIAMIQKTGKKG